jgi:hypothetical protein
MTWEPEGDEWKQYDTITLIYDLEKKSVIFDGTAVPVSTFFDMYLWVYDTHAKVINKESK